MNKIVKPLFLLLLLTMMIFSAPVKLIASGELVIAFIDVGQGDSTLVISPEGKTMLIDAGETSQVSAVFKVLNSYGIETIDYMVASHPHNDHINGLIDVLEGYKVGKILEPGKNNNSSVYSVFILEAKKRNVPIEVAREGMSFNLGSVKVDILSPGTTLPDDIDDSSIVMKVSFGSFSALFTGDIGSALEGSLVFQNKVDQVTLLKVAHHGSISSSSEAFLNKALPRYAVVSVGKDNGYGHPSAFVLMRLGVVGASVLRTDMHGTITFKVDGSRTGVASEKNEVQINQNYTPPQFLYVASKNSEVFHYSTCDSVRTIKQENLIKFASREEAVKSGRRPCSICKP